MKRTEGEKQAVRDAVEQTERRRRALEEMLAKQSKARKSGQTS